MGLNRSSEGDLCSAWEKEREAASKGDAHQVFHSGSWTDHLWSSAKFCLSGGKGTFNPHSYINFVLFAIEWISMLGFSCTCELGKLKGRWREKVDGCLSSKVMFRFESPPKLKVWIVKLELQTLKKVSIHPMLKFLVALSFPFLSILSIGLLGKAVVG